ncbi:MAG TPA: hypothetical protein VHI13_14730 [Candidatus Kapabacteria bacterium]|nr:hypothetical protein [Candidatus Kapabacteria bacterium]
MQYWARLNDLDEEDLLRFYRAVVRWAVPRADRFEIRFVEDRYRDWSLVGLFRSLGSHAFQLHEPPPGPVARALFDARPVTVTVVEGRPGADFMAAMTGHVAPPGSIGSESPVEDLYLFAGRRRLLAVMDNAGYGYMLDLEEEEVADLLCTLDAEGLESARLEPAP